MENEYNDKLEKLIEKLQERQQKISKELEKINSIQTKLYEYNDCKRNSHIGIGIITLIFSFFVTKNIINQELINSLLISLGASSTSLLGARSVIKYKINRLKNENPEIDFENSSYEKNKTQRQSLLQRQLKNDYYLSQLAQLKENNNESICCSCTHAALTDTFVEQHSSDDYDNEKTKPKTYTYKKIEKGCEKYDTKTKRNI